VLEYLAKILHFRALGGRPRGYPTAHRTTPNDAASPRPADLANVIARLGYVSRTKRGSNFFTLFAYGMGATCRNVQRLTFDDHFAAMAGRRPEAEAAAKAGILRPSTTI